LGDFTAALLLAQVIVKFLVQEILAPFFFTKNLENLLDHLHFLLLEFPELKRRGLEGKVLTQIPFISH
jgi:hypothetical protein